MQCNILFPFLHDFFLPNAQKVFMFKSIFITGPNKQ